METLYLRLIVLNDNWKFKKSGFRILEQKGPKSEIERIFLRNLQVEKENKLKIWIIQIIHRFNPFRINYLDL